MIDFNKIFRYEDGKLFWIENPNGRASAADGLEAGFLKTSSAGYQSRYVMYKGVHYVVARVIYQMLVGEIPDNLEVDHADNNSLNNKIDNLRLATYQQQCTNQLIRKDNKSGFKGVSWHKQSGKWQAQISVDGKRTTLGRFSTPEAAYAVYCAVAEDLYGAFSNDGGCAE